MIEQPPPPSTPPLLVCHCLFRSQTMRVWAPVSFRTRAATSADVAAPSAFASAAGALETARNSTASVQALRNDLTGLGLVCMKFFVGVDG